MSHDLGRAFDDLADAAAHAAERGILAAPAVEPTLHRLVTQVRRRRATRTAAVGALALAVVVGAAGAVDAGWFGRGAPAPPADGPTTTPGPSPTETGPTAPAMSPTGLQCGATEDYLQELGDPYVTEPVAGVTAPRFPDTAVDDVVEVTITVENFGAEKMSQLDTDPTLVLVRDGVIVGGGAFDTGSRGPALAGESTDYWMTQPVRACAADGAEVGSGDGFVEPGDYAAWVVVTATPLGTSETVQNVGGPFALTLRDPADPVDPVEALFGCNLPAKVSETALPDARGLTLAADLPTEGWATGTAPEWSATLGVAGDDTILANVDLSPHLAFVDGGGIVVGRTVQGDSTVDLLTVGPGAPQTLFPGSEPAACGSTGIPGGFAGEGPTFMPGTYTAWPFVTVVLKEIQHADGSVEVPSAEPVVVVGTPIPVTFG